MRDNKVVHFMVQDIRMCIHLCDVSKVLPLVKLEKVPGSPNYLAGVMNLNGESIPIIDLALRTGLMRQEKYSLDTTVLLCQHNDGKVGFIIDRIIGLADINESSLQMQDEFKESYSLFLGSIIENSEPSLLVNTACLLEKNDRKVL